MFDWQQVAHVIRFPLIHCKNVKNLYKSIINLFLYFMDLMMEKFLKIQYYLRNLQNLLFHLCIFYQLD